MNTTDLLEFVIVVVAALTIVGVVIEAWKLIEGRREAAEDERLRQLFRQRYGTGRR